MNAPSEMAETELETKLEQIMDRVLNRRMDQLKNQIKDEVLSEVKASISNQMGNMEGQIFELQNENAALKSRIDKLEKQTDIIQDNKVQNVLNDQYARRSNMVVFGLLEAKKENCVEKVIQVIHQHLKINLQPREIEIAHRLGRSNGNRPMIVKFRFRDTKWDIMKSRKMLKGTGITFSEDLNSEMQKLYREVYSSGLTSACWAWNGKIQAKDGAGKVHTIHYGKEWRHLFVNAAEAPAAGDTAPQVSEDAAALDTGTQSTGGSGWCQDPFCRIR